MKVYAVTAHKIKGQIWGSKLLMWFSKLPFSHVCLLFESDHAFIFESVAPRSRMLEFDKWIEEYAMVEKYHIADITDKEADVFVQCMDGIPYSKCQLAVIFINYIARLLFNKLKFMTIDNGDLICTEVYTMFVRIFRNYVFEDKKDLIDLNNAYESIKFLEIKK